MALRNTVVLITFVALALCGVCSGVIYRVGDSNGWTSRGLVDYNKWASTKDFHVADTLIFSYNNQFHNVMQVTDQDFQSCNTTSAMSTHTSGSDTITLKRPGHYYFLCGTLGHCQAGQKVDIKVTLPIPDNFLQSPSPSPSSSHPQVTIPSSSALSNAQSTLHSLKLGLAITAFVFCL